MRAVLIKLLFPRTLTQNLPSIKGRNLWDLLSLYISLVFQLWVVEPNRILKSKKNSKKEVNVFQSKNYLNSNFYQILSAFFFDIFQQYLAVAISLKIKPLLTLMKLQHENMLKITWNYQFMHKIISTCLECTQRENRYFLEYFYEMIQIPSN